MPPKKLAPTKPSTKKPVAARPQNSVTVSTALRRRSSAIAAEKAQIVELLTTEETSREEFTTEWEEFLQTVTADFYTECLSINQATEVDQRSDIEANEAQRWESVCRGFACAPVYLQYLEEGVAIDRSVERLDRINSLRDRRHGKHGVPPIPTQKKAPCPKDEPKELVVMKSANRVMDNERSRRLFMIEMLREQLAQMDTPGGDRVASPSGNDEEDPIPLLKESLDDDRPQTEEDRRQMKLSQRRAEKLKAEKEQQEEAEHRRKRRRLRQQLRKLEQFEERHAEYLHNEELRKERAHLLKGDQDVLLGRKNILQVINERDSKLHKEQSQEERATLNTIHMQKSMGREFYQQLRNHQSEVDARRGREEASNAELRTMQSQSFLPRIPPEIRSRAIGRVKAAAKARPVIDEILMRVEAKKAFSASVSMRARQNAPKL